MRVIVDSFVSKEDLKKLEHYVGSSVRLVKYEGIHHVSYDFEEVCKYLLKARVTELSISYNEEHEYAILGAVTPETLKFA